MKPIITWVLIADGGQAKVFAHEGPGKGLQPVKDLQFEQAHLRAQDIMADKPGRSFASAGSSRSAIESSSDPVQFRETRFVTLVAEMLDRLHQEGAFTRLIIAAAPTALGDIRAALSDGLKKVIVAELPKDLTNTPRKDLDSHFEDLLAV